MWRAANKTDYKEKRSAGKNKTTSAVWSKGLCYCRYGLRTFCFTEKEKQLGQTARRNAETQKNWSKIPKRTWNTSNSFLPVLFQAYLAVFIFMPLFLLKTFFLMAYTCWLQFGSSRFLLFQGHVLAFLRKKDSP